MKAIVKIIGCLSLLTMTAGVSAHDLLTGKNGMTLYTFDRDDSAKAASTCSWHCIKVWPPAAAQEMSEPGFGAITREAGARQLTYEGRPLYYYIGDHGPGDANGDGIERVWHVVIHPRVTAKR